jgi:hypothetical protein
MPVRTKSLATIATVLAIALAAPAAFAADQMTNNHDTSGGTAMDKGMSSAKPHSGNDAMSHSAKDKMSGSSTMSNTSGDSAMSHDKK